jgi:hypothetical protein
MSAYVSTKDLHFQASGRSFFQEISHLPNKRIPLMRVYPDACDVGFYLVSHSTGMEILMVESNVKRDREGEITSWMFTAVDKNAPIRNVVIVND